jgi:hypothetical protein
MLRHTGLVGDPGCRRHSYNGLTNLSEHLTALLEHLGDQAQEKR